MASDKIKVILIEDNPSDSLLIRENLSLEEPGVFLVTISERLADGMKLMDKEGYDVAMLDLWLPDSAGIETLKRFRDKFPEMPVIVFTGLDNNETSIQALKAGAQDYIVKSHIEGVLLTRSIRYAIERKNIRKELDKSRNDLEGIIDNAPLLMFIVDSGIKVLKANKTAEKIIKFPREKMGGMALGKAIQCENCFSAEIDCGKSEKCRTCGVRLVISEAFKTGESYHRMEIEKTIIAGNKSEKSVFYMSVVPLEFENKKTMLVSFEDVTLRKRAENGMEEIIHKLRDLDGLKSNFVSMVSHELRTPLTSVKGFISFLINGVAGPVNERQAEYLQIIRDNSDRLLNLINDLLDISKMESGTFMIEKHSSDLVKLLKKVIRDLGPAADKMKIQFEGNFSGPVMTADVDDFRIGQVASNLINNALKFSYENGKITVSAEEKNAGDIKMPEYAGAAINGARRYAVISVKDGGRGIEKEHLAKIFDRFYQVHGIDQKVFKGIGLGLNISKNIVEAHNGAIWVESEGNNKGTVFKFILPL